MISTMTYGLPERIRTLELLAEHWPTAVDAAMATSPTSSPWPSSWPTLADATDAAAVRGARRSRYDWKANHTEVTALDRAAEAAIADRLAAERPAPPLARRGVRRGRRARLAVAVDRRPDRRHVRATCAASRCGRR